MKYTKESIARKLNEYYPDKNIINLSNYKNLYRGIIRFCKKNHIDDYKQFLISLGFTLQTKYTSKYTKKYIIKKLNEYYPNKIILSISSTPKLYEGIKRYCKRNNVASLLKFIESLGFSIKNPNKLKHTIDGNKKYIVKKLNEYYPNKVITNIEDKNILCYKIEKYCKRKKIDSSKLFLESLGYTIKKS